jgi:hypothetical protein
MAVAATACSFREIEMMNKGDSALALAQKGYHVFPCHYITGTGVCSCGSESCHSPGKHPRTTDGFKSATTDDVTIRRWWESEPNANIGLRTGPESGVIVVDLDGPEGIEAWEALVEQNGGCPETACARSGGGGEHKYFKYPADREIKGRSRIGGKPIDARGSGGYIVVPPSNHVSGNEYQWIKSILDRPPAEAPEWVLDLVTRKGKAPQRGDEDNEAWFNRVTGGLDLESDPGVPEGQRHDRACQLIGAHLGAGDEPSSILVLALEWGARCNPPMDQKEVIRIFTDLLAKEAEKGGDEIGQPQHPWPKLGEAALHGLPGEIVKAIEPETEADSVAILVQLLVFFGNVVGRKAWFRVEATTHYCNLYAILVGETAKARKGTSEGWVKSLFKFVDSAWEKFRIQTGVVSGEGLISNVRDRVEKDDKKPADAGIHDKRLLIIEEEFAQILHVMRREGNTLSAVLRMAWDGKNLQTMAKQSPARATGAHVSFVGHITKEELLHLIRQVEGFNGFANRFGWYCVMRSKELPLGGKKIDLEDFGKRLDAAVVFASSAGEMQRDEAATKLWVEVYHELSKAKRGLLGAVTSRAEAQVVRLSMVYALMDQSKTIRVEHLQAALALWQYAEDSARSIFGDSTGNPLADKILAMLREGPATKKEIWAKLNRHGSADTLESALALLRRMGLARCEEVKTKGRPAQRWYAT